VCATERLPTGTHPRIHAQTRSGTADPKQTETLHLQQRDQSARIAHDTARAVTLSAWAAQPFGSCHDGLRLRAGEWRQCDANAYR
jgi:hypothetical protein